MSRGAVIRLVVRAILLQQALGPAQKPHGRQNVAGQVVPLVDGHGDVAHGLGDGDGFSVEAAGLGQVAQQGVGVAKDYGGTAPVFVLGGQPPEPVGIFQGLGVAAGDQVGLGQRPVGLAHGLGRLLYFHPAGALLHQAQAFLTVAGRAEFRAQAGEEDGVGLELLPGQAEHPAAIGVDAVGVPDDFHREFKKQCGGLVPQLVGQGLLNGHFVVLARAEPGHDFPGNPLRVWCLVPQKGAEQLVVAPVARPRSRLHEQAALHDRPPKPVGVRARGRPHPPPEVSGQLEGKLQGHAGQAQEGAHVVRQRLPQAAKDVVVKVCFQGNFSLLGSLIPGRKAGQRSDGQGPAPRARVPGPRLIRRVAERPQLEDDLVGAQGQVVLCQVEGGQGVESMFQRGRQPATTEHPPGGIGGNPLRQPLQGLRGLLQEVNVVQQHTRYVVGCGFQASLQVRHVLVGQAQRVNGTAGNSSSQGIEQGRLAISSRSDQHKWAALHVSKRSPQKVWALYSAQGGIYGRFADALLHLQARDHGELPRADSMCTLSLFISQRRQAQNSSVSDTAVGLRNRACSAKIRGQRCRTIFHSAVGHSEIERGGGEPWWK